MLNKKICKKCLKEHLVDYGEWTKTDIIRWKEGYIFCTMILGAIKKNEIPDFCKYYTEQVISNP